MYRKCIKCRKLKKHKARGLCLDCYKDVYNKEYYKKNISKFRKYSSLKKICVLCNNKIKAKNKFGVGGLKYCKKCMLEKKRKEARERAREYRKIGKPYYRLTVKICKECKEKKPIHARGLCIACYNRFIRQDKSKQLLKCPICNLKLIQISSSHLKLHKLTVKKFKEKYPGIPISKEPIGVEKYIMEHGMKAFIERQIKAGKKRRPLSGKKHPLYKASSKYYRGYNWFHQRRKAKERDLRLGRYKKGEDVVVHHKKLFELFILDYIEINNTKGMKPQDIANLVCKKANKLSNLITILRNKHSKLSAIQWKNLSFEKKQKVIVLNKSYHK